MIEIIAIDELKSIDGVEVFPHSGIDDIAEFPVLSDISPQDIKVACRFLREYIIAQGRINDECSFVNRLFENEINATAYIIALEVRRDGPRHVYTVYEVWGKYFKFKWARGVFLICYRQPVTIDESRCPVIGCTTQWYVATFAFIVLDSDTSYPLEGISSILVRQFFYVFRGNDSHHSLGIFSKIDGLVFWTLFDLAFDGDLFDTSGRGIDIDATQV